MNQRRNVGNEEKYFVPSPSIAPYGYGRTEFGNHDRGYGNAPPPLSYRALPPLFDQTVRFPQQSSHLPPPPPSALPLFPPSQLHPQGWGFDPRVEERYSPPEVGYHPHFYNIPPMPPPYHSMYDSRYLPPHELPFIPYPVGPHSVDMYERSPSPARRRMKTSYRTRSRSPPPASGSNARVARTQEKGHQQKADRHGESFDDLRARMEKPCRELFVRNVNPKVCSEQIQRLFERYGQIKEVSVQHLDSRGIVFVTFFDVRNAENAKDELQGFVFQGRKLDTHYSLPRIIDDVLGPCNRDRNQGTLVVTHEKCVSSPATSFEIQQIFGRFGEIRSVREFRNYENKKFVEYYDSRACVMAHDTMNGQVYKGGRFEIRFAWDYPKNMRITTEQLLQDYREGRQKKSNQPLFFIDNQGTKALMNSDEKDENASISLNINNSNDASAESTAADAKHMDSTEKTQDSPHLLSQMSNLLSMLQKTKDAPSTRENIDEVEHKPASLETVQQLAQLLLQQTRTGPSA